MDIWGKVFSAKGILSTVAIRVDMTGTFQQQQKQGIWWLTGVTGGRRVGEEVSEVMEHQIQ